MRSITVVIPGEAPSQGSMRAFTYKKKNGKIGVNQTHQDSNGIKLFRKNVKEALEQVYAEFVSDNSDIAYEVCAIFYIEKPITVKRVFPTGRFDKDLDKRIRALLDALTISASYNPYGLFKDDSQVVKICAVKKYITPCVIHDVFHNDCDGCLHGIPRTIINVRKIFDIKELDIELLKETSSDFDE